MPSKVSHKMRYISIIPAFLFPSKFESLVFTTFAVSGCFILNVRLWVGIWRLAVPRIYTKSIYIKVLYIKSILTSMCMLSESTDWYLSCCSGGTHTPSKYTVLYFRLLQQGQWTTVHVNILLRSKPVFEV